MRSPFYLSAALLGLLALPGVQAVSLTSHAQEMFNSSMSFLDKIYDPVAGYLYYFYYPLAAGKHETRSSVWYATGLLQRNEGDDLENAIKIIRNVIGGQEKNVSAQWFGDYTVYPEQPSVDSPAYAPVIYNSWDPNWRGFIGTNLIVIYEEYQSILPADVQELILESMYNNSIGDSYRVGGVDDDNLYPSYSNPWLMRAVATGWTGRKLNDSNMTSAGETYAAQALELFNMYDTLSEFNSGTYAGVSLYALVMWAKYLPTDSLMGQNGARMIRQVWDSLSEMYNANLRNLAGPWDRAYGYDMNNYAAIVSLWIWSIVGQEEAPVSAQPWSMNHADDFEYAPLIAVLTPYHNSLLTSNITSKLSCFPGDHTYSTSAYAPPYDFTPRNITTWLSPNLTIGAQSFDQDTLGGPRNDTSQWNPAVVQWARSDGSVGYLTWYSTETALDVDVSAGSLNLSYPKGGQGSVFTFLVGSNPLGGKRDIAGVGDIEGVNITVDGTVNLKPEVSFCGLVGGTCAVIHDFEFWNLTFSMPANTTATPWIHLEVELA